MTSDSNSGEWSAPGSSAGGDERTWHGSAPSSGAPEGPRSGFGESAWKPGIIQLRPLSFGEVLNGAFKALRYNPAVTVGLPALVLVIGQVFLSAGMWSIFGDPSLFDPTSTAPAAFSEGRLAGTIIGLVLGWIVFSLASVIANAFVAVAVSRAILGEKVKAKRAWELTRGRILPLIGYSVLIGTIFAVVFGLVGGFLYLVGTGSPEAIIGFLILLVPVAIAASIYFSVKLLLAPTAIVLENASPLTGLRRGWRLTAGRFWWIFLYVFVGGIIVNVATQVFAIPLSLVASIIPVFWPSLTAIGLNVAQGLSTYLGALLGAVFIGALNTLIYTDQRMRLEGFDMDLISAAQREG